MPSTPFSASRNRAATTSRSVPSRAARATVTSVADEDLTESNAATVFAHVARIAAGVSHPAREPASEPSLPAIAGRLARPRRDSTPRVWRHVRTLAADSFPGGATALGWRDGTAYGRGPSGGEAQPSRIFRIHQLRAPRQHGGAGGQRSRAGARPRYPAVPRVTAHFDHVGGPRSRPIDYNGAATTRRGRGVLSRAHSPGPRRLDLLVDRREE